MSRSGGAGAVGTRRAGRLGRGGHLRVAVGGLAVLVVCGLVARNGTVGAAEASVFRAVNRLPDWLYPVVWPFQQLGNLLVALAVMVVIALALRRPRIAVLAVVAVVLKLGLERVVKTVVERQRPATSIGDAVLRGDVQASGLSFVSGHATITAAAAGLLVPALPRRWKPVPWAVVAMNGMARVYVGAHNPLDVVGGVGLGLLIAGLLNAAVPPGAWRRPDPAPPPRAG